MARAGTMVLVFHVAVSTDGFSASEGQSESCSISFALDPSIHKKHLASTGTTPLAGFSGQKNLI